MSDPLASLANLTDVLYQAELVKMHGINAREGKLRADLIALGLHHRANMALPDAQLSAPRQIGADVLWQGWVGRSRVDLNQQLALVLAQKSQMMKTLRRAHGKHQATAQLLKDAISERRTRFDDKRNQQEQNLLMIKSYEE